MYGRYRGIQIVGHYANGSQKSEIEVKTRISVAKEAFHVRVRRREREW